jgi:sterol desaturase/sphingolipid hydroxylase (fatty acid hydroxylase superfamily)
MERIAIMSFDWSASEPLIRMSAFAAVLATMALTEVMAPRRPQAHSRLSRWPANLGLVVVSALLIKLVFPLSAVAFALWCEGRGIGLLNLAGLPAWAAVPLAVVALDLAIYTQHVVFHHVPVLWRLHRMHHADLEFDTTTGIRFHPIEMILSMAIKFAVIAVLGAPALAVLLFEILLNATALFSHANARLPLGVDRIVRLFVVTPDMHRIHHSVVPQETHSNFGFCTPWWDRLFRTYRDQPAAGHDAMQIGLPIFRDADELRIDRLLTQPFRTEK